VTDGRWLGISPGYFWGDLLWANKLPAQNGQYVFQPNEVEYRVDSKSALGQQIANHFGGIVVHQYYSDPQAKPVPWNGQGLHKNNTVAILTPTVGLKFRLNEPVQLIKAVSTAIKTQGSTANSFISGASTDVLQSIKTYTNKRITGQTTEDLLPWLKNNSHDSAYSYVKYQTASVAAVLAIWNVIYQLKEDLAGQLNRQVTGVSQYVEGHPQGEGFVLNTPAGQLKLINRRVFSAANFKRNP
jgi:hypothetical protein